MGQEKLSKDDFSRSEAQLIFGWPTSLSKLAPRDRVRLDISVESSSKKERLSEGMSGKVNGGGGEGSKGPTATGREVWDAQEDSEYAVDTEPTPSVLAAFIVEGGEGEGETGDDGDEVEEEEEMESGELAFGGFPERS